ncbi:hypothetical protein ACJMK2_002045 [Sinanodonta woodiana]|uniref:Uncharacterized protein n=1 Tax=Sinanodonta woodiana TaxID=1069815 RepID=A0ABD3XU45_SINWO
MSRNMRHKRGFSWIILILLMEYTLSEDSCQISQLLGKLSFGSFLPRSVFTTKYQISIHQCATECQLRRQRCKSFNYRRSALSFQLCEEDSGPGGIHLQARAGTDHSNIDTWTNIPIRHCNERNCSWTERCDPSNVDPHSSCVKTECPFAVLKPGLTIHPSNETVVGTKARYRCVSEDMERGSYLTTCLASTAEWYPVDFKCVCKTPMAKSGTVTEAADVELGQNYTYRCQDGLTGKRDLNPTVMCQLDGDWTTTDFTCVCKMPMTNSGTIIEAAEVELGQNYTYRCQEGLIGKRDQIPTVTCQPGGDWMTANFTCVCKTPIAKSGMINETVEVELGQNYTYKCQYGLIGKRNLNPTVTCLPGGVWTTTNFTCVCKTPNAKSGTINEAAEVELGQNYTYRCQDGLIGRRDQNPTVTCLPGDEWTNTNFTCVCTIPAKPGTINSTAEVEIGQSYTYRCEINLFMRGDENTTITCLHDGNWTPTNFICVTQNWTLDTIYPNNIHKSEVISKHTGIDLLACMQQCDNTPNKCLSFFYDNQTGFCVLSSSFQRGPPNGFNFSGGVVYYTAPSSSCDLQYRNVTLSGSYFCIKYHWEAKSFDEAMKSCESEKAKLLVVTTKDEITDLTQLWQIFCK